jgi:hypothetical protein
MDGKENSKVLDKIEVKRQQCELETKRVQILLVYEMFRRVYTGSFQLGDQS